MSPPEHGSKTSNSVAGNGKPDEEATLRGAMAALGAKLAAAEAARKTAESAVRLHCATQTAASLSW